MNGARISRLGYTRSLTLIVALGVVAACTASQQKPAVAATMADPELRREALEATLRVTDEHPQYVDELFALTLKHPRTLDRFLKNTARTLSDDKFARMTARRLAEHPDGVRQVLIATLDAISDKPAALTAVAQAMEERPQVSAMAIVQRDEAVRAVLEALLQEARKDRKARLAFLASVRENATPMAELVVKSPETMSALLGGFAEAGVDRGKTELEALVRAIEPNSNE